MPKRAAARLNRASRTAIATPSRSTFPAASSRTVICCRCPTTLRIVQASDNLASLTASPSSAARQAARCALLGAPARSASRTPLPRAKLDRGAALSRRGRQSAACKAQSQAPRNSTSRSIVMTAPDRRAGSGAPSDRRCVRLDVSARAHVRARPAGRRDGAGTRRSRRARSARDHGLRPRDAVPLRRGRPQPRARRRPRRELRVVPESVLSGLRHSAPGARVVSAQPHPPRRRRRLSTRAPRAAGQPRHRPPDRSHLRDAAQFLAGASGVHAQHGHACVDVGVDRRARAIVGPRSRATITTRASCRSKCASRSSISATCCRCRSRRRKSAPKSELSADAAPHDGAPHRHDGRARKLRRRLCGRCRTTCCASRRRQERRSSSTTRSR